MTETKKLQAQLIYAQKMEAIGRLAGGIVHDFNNILTGILGYANLLKANHKDKHDIYFGIEQIEAAANRATQLTQRLLDLAHKDKHQHLALSIEKHTLQNTSVELPQVIVGVLRE